MHYKVILVHEKTNGCSRTPIAGEVEVECNRMGAQGYVLVTAYRQTAAGGYAGQACNSGQSEVGAILIFAKPN